MPQILSDAQAASLGELAGAAVDDVRLLRGGGNNVVVSFQAGGQMLVAKFYFVHARDPRDRLGAEFGMMSFLWRHGVRNIAEPVARDDVHHLAIYGYIEGRALRPGDIEAAHVHQLRDHLIDLARLRGEPGAEILAPVSEACLALADYTRHTGRRLDRVAAALDGANDDTAKAAGAFVRDEVRGVYRDAERFLHASAQRAGWPIDLPLPAAARTLSPADHGFHNALLTDGGRLVFYDFEYAGWDDPAQMIANACLQPEVPIPGGLRPAFVRDMLAAFPGDSSLRERLQAVYPVLCIKWTLIMLNEFMPVDRERRRFAGADPERRRERQLEKARGHLERARNALAKPDQLVTAGAP